MNCSYVKLLIVAFTLVQNIFLFNKSPLAYLRSVVFFQNADVSLKNRSVNLGDQGTDICYDWRPGNRQTSVMTGDQGTDI